MNYNPKLHKQKSIRLQGYDYAQKGLYFVTICCQNKEHFYGEIVNGEMQLNDAAKMISSWYYELENKFPDIKRGEMIIMPNHFHCIIQNVGADLRVCPNTPYETTPTPDGKKSILGNTTPILSKHIGSPLHRVVQWFKTMTTNEYIRNVKSNNWKRFDKKLWQRNYWKHIIRNEKPHEKIANYIISNPQNWKEDFLS